MKLRIAKHTFSKALALAQSVASKRSTMPILGYVKLTCDVTHLTLESTDLEVSVSERVECSAVAAPGSICLDAKLLAQVVKDAAGDEILLEAKGNSRIQVSTGASKFMLNGMSEDDFPGLFKAASDPKLAAAQSAEVLYESLRSVAFSMSTDESRYNLCGINVSTAEGVTRYAGTDGHRLAVTVGPEIEGLQESIIIPRKGVEGLLDFLSSAEECQLSTSGGFLHVVKEGSHMSIRLVDGKFPDYTKVIPTTQPASSIVCDREALLQGLRRVRLVATDSTKSVRLTVQDGAVELRSTSPEYGEAVDRVAAWCVPWDTSVGFSVRLLAELLASSKADRVSIGLTSDVGPAVFRFEGDGANDDFLGIVMPMRFEGK